MSSGTGSAAWLAKERPDLERSAEIAALAREVKNYLEYMGELGVDRLPRVEVPAPAVNENVQPPAAQTAPQPAAPRLETLEGIRDELGDCTRCLLHQGRKKLVFGEGAPEAAVMFVGEGPGHDEDLQGRPFVGRSGQLLTDIIVKGMQMRREDCYIANVVKCRPPENRDPLPEEAKTCLPFLLRQIRAVKPKVIITLGRVAAQYLLDTEESVARLRNRFHDLEGIPVMPTFHPSYLLRTPAKKRETWDDIKMVLARLREEGILS